MAEGATDRPQRPAGRGSGPPVRPAPISEKSETEGKFSARAFAAEVGVRGWGEHVIARHLAAWTLAAEAGLVPPLDEMFPGRDVPLPDADWSDFYDGSGPRQQPQAQDPAPVAAAVQTEPEPVIEPPAPVAVSAATHDAGEGVRLADRMRQRIEPRAPQDRGKIPSTLNVLSHAVERVKAAGPFADGSTEADEIRRLALALLDTIEATAEEVAEGVARSAPQPAR